MHHECRDDEEDCKEKSAKISIDTESDLEAAADKHQAGNDDREFGCRDLLILRVASHCFELGEVCDT